MSTLWNQVLEDLKPRLAFEDVEEWLKPARYISHDKQDLFVMVPEEVFIEYIEENFLQEIYASLRKLGFPAMRVRFVGQDDAPCLKTRSDVDNGSLCETSGLRINSRYKFDNFVIGASNQFAHAAARAVADAPSSSFNPLYIYGSSGLGKTHLLHAIGHQLLSSCQHLKSCYTTCEEFTNQFINSIRYNRVDWFRERYRSVDVLLIDDIQFLSGKTQTQEEFFHTFNALFEQQKQIIFSSDCAPSDIPKLESRLKSRFQWGLCADIQPPPLETRIAILRKKAEQEDSRLPDDVLLFIANKVKTNVRELEGALIKVLAYSSLSRKPIDLELAGECLRSMIKADDPDVSCEKIQRFIAEQYNLTTKELRSKSNTKRIAFPRQLAMYLTRQMTGMSLPEIGAAFGNKHHSTVHYSVQKVIGDLQRDGQLARLVESFRRSLA